MDYISLNKQIIEAGLLKRQYGYYALKLAILTGLLATSIFLLITLNNFAMQLLNAVFMAFLMVQFAMYMHDAGHQQIFKSGWNNSLAGFFTGNIVNHASSGTWTYQHNMHHSSPNDEDVDPDVNISLLAYSEEQALSKKGIARLIVKHQALLWFPLMTIAATSKRISLFKILLKNLNTGNIKYARLDALLVVSGLALYLGLIFYFLNLWQAVVFIIVNQLFTGFYMGTVFATNHKAMTMTTAKLDFMTRQIITTRNVRSNFFTDFWCGGLNLQVEHHLFTNMPRNNFRKARKLIKPYCEKKQHRIL